MMEPMFTGGGLNWVGIGVVTFAVALIALGFRIIRRITRNPDEGDDPWRSHRR